MTAAAIGSLFPDLLLALQYCLGPLELPDQPENTDTKGSLVGGLLLTGFGAVALAHTVLDLRTDWIEEWWPAVLVVIGLYLIVYSTLKNRKAEN